MTVLCDWEIAGLCRLSRMVSPFDEELVNPASIDVRLGHHIMIETNKSSSLEDVDITGYTKEEPYLLNGGEFVLAQTIETFKLPPNISAQFALKSSRGREGYDHAQAGFCDPGWSGVLTLELINARRLWPLPLYPGLKIGQMIFFKNEIPEKHYGITGRYNGDVKVTASRG